LIKEVRSYEETLNLGKCIGEKAKPGDVYCLVGDLGTGKTVISKGIASALGVNDITSPTFTIVNVYDDAKMPLYHFDVYRITDEDEMYDLGYEEMVYGNGITVIEWADLISGIVPNDAIWIHLYRDLTKGEDYRRIELAGKNYDL